MRKILVVILLTMPFCLRAAAPPRGADRLRELVVFPRIDLNFYLGIGCQNNEWVVNQNLSLTDAIARLREELKRRPNDVKSLMRLGYLLDSNAETNESQVYYQKAEQLCRDKIAVSPQDGLSWMTLGATLDALDKKDEAENSFRKAVLISSNEWRCWVNLGNYLENDAFGSMFPKNLRNLAAPGQTPSPAILDYRPPPDVLKKSKAQCTEAARCFDRAVAIAPKEPEVFFQRAGFMSLSNQQNCYIGYYRDHEQINSNEWISAFFSKETVANLKQAAALKPKDYQYVSLAAYFEYYVPMIQSQTRANAPQFTLESLPDNAKRSIHGAMTQLENLSQDPDQKIAAGALENLGMLQMLFNNQTEALADIRRVVALDPIREQAWDMLLGILLTRPSPDTGQILAVCQARLKINDSARNHLFLSKAFVKMKKWNEASEQAKIACQQETNNVVPPLMLAAIALKQSEQTNYLTEAGEHLLDANDIAQKMTSNDEQFKRFREYVLDAAIYYALSGEPETARSWISSLLKRVPDDVDAKDILSALN